MRQVGLIGTRHVHAPGLARLASAAGWKLAGAVEADEAARVDWQQRDICALRTLDELLDDVDAVIVAGTNAERVEDSIAALERGIPVLAEKPLAMDASGLDRLAAAAEGRRFATALPVRFARAMQRARDAIRAGAIGTPIGGRGTNHGQYPGGWFGSRAEAGGGAIMDHTVHLADGYAWLLDQRVSSVYAVEGRRMHPELDVDSEGVVTLGFESGCFVSIDASWSRPESFHTWGDVWMELVGTEGRLIIDPMARHLQHFSDRAGKLVTLGYDEHNMTGELVERFLDYAAHGGDSPVSLADGAHATGIVFAAYESARSGEVVRPGVTSST